MPPISTGSGNAAAIFSREDLGLYFGGLSGALISMIYNRILKEKTLNQRIKDKTESVRRLIFKL
jgi:hypothetical protein